MIRAISPIDGRYEKKTEALGKYFSEAALIRYRLFVEIEYFKSLIKLNLPQLKSVHKSHIDLLDMWIDNLSDDDFINIKNIETETNHDVKAVEYYIKNKFIEIGLTDVLEFVHFGLTSQDINNTAFPLMIRDGIHNVYLPMLNSIIDQIKSKASLYKQSAMLCHTHGQPASPSTMGKELMVFVERLTDQKNIIENLPFKAKFGGATGNFNAHIIAYPSINWVEFSDQFIESIGLIRSKFTTQIAHYDHLAAIFDALSRIHTILMDLAKDIWTYISMNYFSQKSLKNEVGSSTMPHKINPIDFENAEGNLGFANSMLRHLSEKLPISRLQRDLTDSTVLRNVGVPIGHAIIAFSSLAKGLNKIDLNESKLSSDLNNNWAIISEAIQTILRRENYPKPYEALKALTRGGDKVTEDSIRIFITELNISDAVKKELHAITPWNYIGNAADIIYSLD